MLPLLSIQNLTVGFRQQGKITHALQGISFNVKKNEIVAIVGESGSGKSVTSLAVLQLLPVPSAEYMDGKILFSENGINDVDLIGLPLKNMQSLRGNQIGMIFQEPMTALNPVYTCGNQVMEAMRIHQALTANEAKQKVLRLFEKVKLPDPAAMFKRYPHEISGGQKQRVMIAMALCSRPLLLIADEPTTALDVTVQQDILHLLKDLQADLRMGIIFISHDLGLVAEIADRVVVMYKGKIVEENTVQNIFTNPRHPYTKALLACRPVLHSKGERLPVVNDFMEVNENGDIFSRDKSWEKQNSVTEIKTKETVTASIPLLEVNDLKVWFLKNKTILGKNIDYIKAVNGVSFSISKGETIGLVGESGCGKTTLGRSVLRLIEPTSGTISFKGTNLLDFSTAAVRHIRKDLQIIFQDPYSSLNPRISVGSAIQEAMYVHGIGASGSQRKDLLVDILEKVDLKADHYNRYPHEFSGGQRQRIGIARALALNPSFIICDESVSALDVSVQAQVLNLLNDLKKEFGFAVLFISHDLSVVRYISDRIMVMYKGKIEESGEAEEIYNNPQTVYTRKLIEAIPKGIV